MYSATTHDITVSVESVYLENESRPDENVFVWAYHVTIRNNGKNVVQLKSRHWRITDSNGRTQEVRGAGVVGEQPVLQPGQSFKYTSGTPLGTPSGIMEGAYQMETSSGLLDIRIPAFSLDSPHQKVQLN